jgi:hypothetical protein
MPKRIRIVETVVYDYEPDFAENCYAANNITTVEAALEVDKADYEAHKISLGELCYNLPTHSTVWEIIDVPV